MLLDIALSNDKVITNDGGMVMERTGVVTFAGNPLTLLGSPTKVGDKAPGFTLVDKDLKEVALSDFVGKAKIISVTPSLDIDTPVCDLQARRFNEEAQTLSHHPDYDRALVEVRKLIG